jgi:hypothetical protein
MGQTALLSSCAAKDRWRPVLPTFRPRPFARIAKRKPLLGQMFLPGMGPDEPGDALLPPSPTDNRPPHGELGSVARPEPICPNCGGTEFDEDGDCTSCWEPAVARPTGGTGRTRRSTRRLRGAK